MDSRFRGNDNPVASGNKNAPVASGNKNTPVASKGANSLVVRLIAPYVSVFFLNPIKTSSGWYVCVDKSLTRIWQVGGDN